MDDIKVEIDKCDSCSIEGLKRIECLDDLSVDAILYANYYCAKNNIEKVVGDFTFDRHSERINKNFGKDTITILHKGEPIMQFCDKMRVH